MSSIQRFDLLPTQRVPPLYYFEISMFGDRPNKCSKAPLEPISTLRGEPKLSIKSLKTFFYLFFKFCLRRRKFGENRVFSAMGELGKSV